jgi:excinuclease ABC subunit C
VADKVDDADTAGLVHGFLQQLYADEAGDAIPREVLVPALPEDHEALEQWLTDKRGARVSVRVPQRGDKKALLETVARNALQALGLHKTKRASDLTTRNRALEEIQVALGLPTAPLRIECFDISNLHGTEVVGSMVVFEDGLPKRTDYRRFEIKGVAGQDDFASMEEMLTRRFARLARERSGAEPKRRRFSYPPALVVVDGGRGQLSVATKVLAEAGQHIPAIGLAKRLEEVYFPERPDPLMIPRGSEALFVLQHLRDEAHRFALTYHRQKRAKRALASPLDDIPGVGPTRKKALLKRFGSVARLSRATVEEIAATRGVGPELARVVHERLTGAAALPRRESA